MQAYNVSTRVFNLSSVPKVPELVMPLAQRIRLSKRRLRGDGKHKGRKRRHRREVQVKQGQGWLCALHAGERVMSADGRMQHTLRELLDSYVPDCPRGLMNARIQVRVLLDLAAKHGPGSGWGIRQSERAEWNPGKWTPYWIPKASEKCWRWWRHVLLALKRVLRLLDRWLSSLVPLHRALRSYSNGEERSRVTESGGLRGSTRYRDHGPEPLGLILRRSTPLDAM